MKHITCRIIIIFLLIYGAVPGMAQDKTRTKNNKADIYDNIYEVYLEASKHRSDSTCIALSDSMRQLAIAQGDKRAIAMSWANPQAYYLSISDEKQLYETTELLKKTSEEAELWSFYYHAIMQKAVYLQRRNRVGEALELGEKAMQKAYADNNHNGIYSCHGLLANCYLVLRLYDKGLEEASKALQAEIGLPDNNFGNSLTKVMELLVMKEKWQACLDSIAKYEPMVEGPVTIVRMAEYRALCSYMLGHKDDYLRYTEESRVLQEKYGKSTATSGASAPLKGIRLWEDGKKEEAVKFFDSLGVPHRHYYLGWAHRQTGNVEGLFNVIQLQTEYWQNRLNILYDTEVKKYGLELENNNLELINRELALQRNQLMLNNRNLELSNQNLELEQSVLEMKEAQAQSELEQSRLANQYLEAQNKESTAKAQLQEIEARDKERQILTYSGLTILALLMLCGAVLFWHIRRSNVKLKHANKKLEVQAKRLQDDLEAIRQANDANDAKTSFLFNMSHDIRTPMNAIIGFRDLLEKYQDDPVRRADYLRKIGDSSRVLLSIINNVLEMARIEKGTVQMDESVCNARQFNDTIFNVFDELMRQKGITLSRKIDIEHAYVCCDMTKVREVFYNILSNAYKYTPEGGRVSMELKEIASDREGVALYRTTISDTGIGMSEDFLPQLFEEFSRERSTADDQVEGTGLGMPIVKRLVDLMGGTIEVQSQKGVGTTFVVTLPHRIAEQQADREESIVSMEDVSFEGRRILLAEDSELNAEIALDFLAELGIEAHRAVDGQQAVEMIEQAEAGYYSLILMDVRMPRMNGYEATSAIRAMADKAKASIPIVAMTANAFEEDKLNAKQAGMDGHVSKPFEPEQLIAELARYCNPQ